jgi:hypothetical protein
MGKRLTVLTILLLSFVLAAGCNNPLVVGDSLGDFRATDGSRLQLQNNPAAVDVSYNELVAFLDRVVYTKGSCLKLAGALHDMAEANGIRGGILIIEVIKDHHAFNVFQTTDRCEVYVDLNFNKEVKTWEQVREPYSFIGGVYEFW